MPTTTNGNVTLQYGIDGEGETVAFVGEFGYGPWQWAWQHGAVVGPFRAIVPSLRGTGDADRPSGPYDVGTLVADLEAVLADADAGRVHLVGCGLGGMVALEYALTRSRARTLTLLGTTPDGSALSADLADRLFAPTDDPDRLRESLAPVLSDAFLADRSEAIERIVEWRAGEDADREVWRELVAASREFDRRDRLYEVTVPALVLHGRSDRIVPPDAGRRLADGLPRGEFVEFPDAGHLVGIERSAAVNDRFRGFLEEHGEPSY